MFKLPTAVEDEKAHLELLNYNNHLEKLFFLGFICVYRMSRLGTIHRLFLKSVSRRDYNILTTLRISSLI